MLEMVNTDDHKGLAYLKRKVFYVIELQPHNYMPSKIFRFLIVSLIIINVIAVVLETDKQIYGMYQKYFEIIDYISVIVFSFEYFLRIWTCTLYKSLNHRNYSQSITGRLKFAITPYMLIDLMAFLPFFIPYIIGFITVSHLRFIKVFRILKLLRYSRSLKFFIRVIKSKIHDLLVVLELIFICLVIISILMFYIEHTAQPHKFGSILDGMWWGMVTLTTVGYGDIYPITPIGKMLSGFISMLGICVFALPTAIIVSGFSEELRKKQMPWVCPHCDKEIEYSRNALRKHF